MRNKMDATIEYLKQEHTIAMNKVSASRHISNLNKGAQFYCNYFTLSTQM